MSPWTALPIRDATWICKRTATGTDPVRVVPWPGDEDKAPAESIGAVAVNRNGIAAAFHEDQLLIVGVDDDEPRDVDLPEDLQSIHCLTFHDDILYVGGRSSWQDTSRLGWIDVTSEQPSWHSLPPSPVVGDPAQPVHAVFTDGRRLVALDGAYTPKLALVYDIRTPTEPKYLEYVSIPSGVDDKPVAATLGRTYAAILTTSHQDTGKAWRIGIFDGTTLDEIATFYQHAEWSETIEMPTAMLISEDLLVIAQEMKGVGVVRLDDGKPTRFENTASIRPWVQSYLQPDRIEYHATLGQGRVIDVRPTPEPGTFYVVLQRGRKTWWEEITIR